MTGKRKIIRENLQLREQINELRAENEEQRRQFNMIEILTKTAAKEEKKLKREFEKWKDTLQQINGEFLIQNGMNFPIWDEPDLEQIKENWENIKKLINTTINPPRVNSNCEYRIAQWKNLAINLEQLRQQYENCNCYYQP